MQEQELGQRCIPVTPATPSSYGKPGIFQHYGNSNNLSSAVMVPRDRHTPFRENPHPWILLNWKRGAAVPSCVPRETPAKSVAIPCVSPNHGQRHIPSSERIRPSKPTLWKGSRWPGSREYKFLPHKREYSHNATKVNRPFYCQNSQST